MCYSFEVCTASYTVTDNKMILHGSFFCLLQILSQICLHLVFALSFSVNYKTQDGREHRCLLGYCVWREEWLWVLRYYICKWDSENISTAIDFPQFVSSQDFPICVSAVTLHTSVYLVCKRPTISISQLHVAVGELQMLVLPSSFLRAQRIKLQLQGCKVMAFTYRAISVAPSVSFHCRNIPLHVIMRCVSCCI